MQTKEQIQDTIEVLSQIDARNIGEEAMEEVTYRVNDIIISLEAQMDLLPN